MELEEERGTVLEEETGLVLEVSEALSEDADLVMEMVGVGVVEATGDGASGPIHPITFSTLSFES